MSIFENLKFWYDYCSDGYWREIGDKRDHHVPMFRTFGPIVLILVLYLAFVLVIGPKFMQSRPPFKLRKTLLAYNSTMSLLNLAYFVYILTRFNEFLDFVLYVKFETYNLYSEDEEKKIILLGFLYYLSKLIELLDTVFFVLRKKHSQVTFLHVYHHFSVPFFGWIYFRLNVLSPVFLLFGIMNTFIHAIMYGYYALAALGPEMQRYLWWKKYITQLQIGQFIVLSMHTVYFFTFNEGYPLIYIVNYLLNIVFYLYMFGRFYFKTYNRKHRKLQ